MPFFIPRKTFYQACKICCIPTWSLPNPENVGSESNKSNQLVEVCKIHLASEIFKTELEVLLSFTHHVTFPFLHCVEKSTQDELLVILPKLFKGLKYAKMDALSKFVVTMRQVPVHEPSTEIGLKLLHLMSLKAAKGVIYAAIWRRVWLCWGTLGFLLYWLSYQDILFYSNLKIFRFAFFYLISLVQ